MLWILYSADQEVYKSAIASEIASESAKQGYRTILADMSGQCTICSTGHVLQNTCLMSFDDVIAGEVKLESIIYPSPENNHLSYVFAADNPNVSIGEYTAYLMMLESMCDILVINMRVGDESFDYQIKKARDRLLMMLMADEQSIHCSESSYAKWRANGFLPELAGLYLRKNSAKEEEYLLHEAETCFGEAFRYQIAVEKSSIFGTGEKKTPFTLAAERFSQQIVGEWLED